MSLLIIRPLARLDVFSRYMTDVFNGNDFNSYFPLFSKVSVKPQEGSNKRRTTWYDGYVVGYSLFNTPVPYQVVCLDDQSIVDVGSKFLNFVSPEHALAITADEATEPTSWGVMMKAPDQPLWMESVRSEVNSILEKGTFGQLFKVLPSGKTAISSHFIFKLKRDKHGNVERRKSRWVVAGNQQQYGVHYSDDISANGVQVTTVRVFLVLCVTLRLSVTHLDVVTAYLNAELKDEVYIKFPGNFDIDGNKYARLAKSIYGLKQAAHDWQECCRKWILSYDPRIRNSKVDPCLYYINTPGLIALIVVHVDDFMLACTDEAWKANFIEAMGSKFTLNVLGQFNHCLGVGAEWTGDQKVTLTQTAMIRKLVESYGLSEALTVSTPMEVGFELEPTVPKDDNIPYLKLIGELFWIARNTRPDIFHSVAVLSRFSAKCGSSHFKSLKRVLRYLKGTADDGLTLYRKRDTFDIVGFCDADWASDKNSRRSQSGWVVYLSGNPVVFGSTQQKSVALSTTEAELMALSVCVRDMLSLKQLLDDVVTIPLPMVCYCDNMGTVQMMNNGSRSSRSKHIDIRYFFVREKIVEGVIKLVHVPSKENPADMFTKPLPAVSFCALKKEVQNFPS